MALTIVKVVWMAGIHSIIHGIFGLVFITTTGYVNFNPGIIHSFVACHVALIVLGIAVFCVIMWRRPACARLFAVLFLLLALIYIIVGCVYFAEYFPFYANSVFDETFFYTDIECWVGPDYLMTFWHVITFLLLLAIFFWFFYACMLCRLAHCACFIPCPPVTCSKVCEPPPPHPCCKVRWYQKVFKRGKCCPPPPCDPFPACPPTCPPVSLPPCPPRPTCPEQSCKVFSQCPQQSCQILPQDLQTYQTPATVAMQNPLPPPTQVSASAEPPPPPSPLCQPLVTKKCPKFVLTLKPGRLCK